MLILVLACKGSVLVLDLHLRTESFWNIVLVTATVTAFFFLIRQIHSSFCSVRADLVVLGAGDLT